MFTFINSLVPVIALISLGVYLKQKQFVADQAWKGMEKLAYFVLFPALLIGGLANRKLDNFDWFSLLLVLYGTLLVTALLLLCFYLLQKRYSGPEFSSVFQGGIRFNTYIAFAVVSSLYGDEGLAIAAVTFGFMILLINLLCIGFFLFIDPHRDAGLGNILRHILVNPLIIACAIGFFLSATGIGLVDVASNTLQSLGQATLPLGLLVVGAALQLDKLSLHLPPVLLSCLFQFIIKPVLVFGLLFITGISGSTAAVIFIGFMVPTAASSYILASQMGGDTETMASIISFQTLIAFVAMPVLAWLFVSGF